MVCMLPWGMALANSHLPVMLFLGTCTNDSKDFHARKDVGGHGIQILHVMKVLGGGGKGQEGLSQHRPWGWAELAQSVGSLAPPPRHPEGSGPGNAPCLMAVWYAAVTDQHAYACWCFLVLAMCTKFTSVHWKEGDLNMYMSDCLWRFLIPLDLM